MNLDKDLFVIKAPEKLKEYAARHIDASNQSEEKYPLQRYTLSMTSLEKYNGQVLPAEPGKMKWIELKIQSTNTLGNIAPDAITQDEADRLEVEILKNLNRYGAIKTNQLITKLEFCKVQNFFTENHLKAVLQFQV